MIKAGGRKARIFRDGKQVSMVIPIEGNDEEEVVLKFAPETAEAIARALPIVARAARGDLISFREIQIATADGVLELVFP